MHGQNETQQQQVDVYVTLKPLGMHKWLWKRDQSARAAVVAV